MATFLRNVAEFLYDCSDGVSVGDHKDSLTTLDCRDNGLFPVWHDSLNGQLQTLIIDDCYFGQRHLIRLQVLIPRIILGMPLVLLVQSRWRNIVASSPDLHLFLAMLGNRF